MKKILIIASAILIGLIVLANNFVSVKIQEEIFLKIKEQNKAIKGELGALKINTSKKDINCNGFVIYTCTIINPKFGIKGGPKEDLFKAKDIVISNLNIFTGKDILLSLTDVNVIDESELKLEGLFPLNLQVSLNNDKKTSKIFFSLTNESLSLKFNTLLELLKNNDSRIVDYDISIVNKDIKSFIYTAYKAFLEGKAPQVVAMTNKALLGENSFEVKPKEEIINGFSNMISVSTSSENAVKVKEKVDNFLNKKESVLNLSAKNKTGISLNQMINSKSTPLENFTFKVDVK